MKVSFISLTRHCIQKHSRFSKCHGSKSLLYSFFHPPPQSSFEKILKNHLFFAFLLQQKNAIGTRLPFFIFEAITARTIVSNFYHCLVLCPFYFETYFFKLMWTQQSDGVKNKAAERDALIYRQSPSFLDGHLSI